MSSTARYLLLRSGPAAGAENMAADEMLLEAACQFGLPMLRLYAWSEPAASFGYFQAFDHVAGLTPLRPLIRRPTGGGVVPHDRDWTYSLAFPSSHPWHRSRARESYRNVHAWVRDAFLQCAVPATLSPGAVDEGPGQCFAGAEMDDVLWRGQKIAGAAQRRTKAGLLIQGSIQPPSGVDREAWERAFYGEAARPRLGAWEAFAWPKPMLGRIEELARQKYGNPEFIRKR